MHYPSIRCSAILAACLLLIPLATAHAAGDSAGYSKPIVVVTHSNDNAPTMQSNALRLHFFKHPKQTDSSSRFYDNGILNLSAFGFTEKVFIGDIMATPGFQQDHTCLKEGSCIESFPSTLPSGGVRNPIAWNQYREDLEDGSIYVFSMDLSLAGDANVTSQRLDLADIHVGGLTDLLGEDIVETVFFQEQLSGDAHKNEPYPENAPLAAIRSKENPFRWCRPFLPRTPLGECEVNEETGYGYFNGTQNRVYLYDAADIGTGIVAPSYDSLNLLVDVNHKVAWKGAAFPLWTQGAEYSETGKTASYISPLAFFEKKDAGIYRFAGYTSWEYPPLASLANDYNPQLNATELFYAYYVPDPDEAPGTNPTKDMRIKNVPITPIFTNPIAVESMRLSGMASSEYPQAHTDFAVLYQGTILNLDELIIGALGRPYLFNTSAAPYFTTMTWGEALVTADDTECHNSAPINLHDSVIAPVAFYRQTRPDQDDPDAFVNHNPSNNFEIMALSIVGPNAYDAARITDTIVGTDTQKLVVPSSTLTGENKAILYFIDPMNGQHIRHRQDTSSLNAAAGKIICNDEVTIGSNSYPIILPKAVKITPPEGGSYVPYEVKAAHLSNDTCEDLVITWRGMNVVDGDMNDADGNPSFKFDDGSGHMFANTITIVRRTGSACDGMAEELINLGPIPGGDVTVEVASVAIADFDGNGVVDIAAGNLIIERVESMMSSSYAGHAYILHGVDTETKLSFPTLSEYDMSNKSAGGYKRIRVGSASVSAQDGSIEGKRLFGPGEMAADTTQTNGSDALAVINGLPLMLPEFGCADNAVMSPYELYSSMAVGYSSNYVTARMKMMASSEDNYLAPPFIDGNLPKTQSCSEKKVCTLPYLEGTEVPVELYDDHPCCVDNPTDLCNGSCPIVNYFSQIPADQVSTEFSILSTFMPAFATYYMGYASPLCFPQSMNDQEANDDVIRFAEGFQPDVIRNDSCGDAIADRSDLEEAQFFNPQPIILNEGLELAPALPPFQGSQAFEIIPFGLREFQPTDPFPGMKTQSVPLPRGRSMPGYREMATLVMLPARNVTCGDGVLEGEETCEEGVACNAATYGGIVVDGICGGEHGQTGADACTCAYCGDGIWQEWAGETCDPLDPAPIGWPANQHCNATCDGYEYNETECGNNITETWGPDYEQCDPPNTAVPWETHSTSGVDLYCDENCRNAYCGDGQVNTDVEQCDNPRSANMVGTACSGDQDGFICTPDCQCLPPPDCTSHEECADEDPCTKDECVQTGQYTTECQHTPDVGVTCEDGNPCTRNDTCDAQGSCQSGSEVECEDNTECSTDTCNPDTGECEFAPDDTVCDNGNPCTIDVCAPGSGGIGCESQPSDPGTDCDDSDACTAGDACDGSGVCQGNPVACVDGNNCTADSCNPTIGCIFDATAKNGTDCDDQNACTVGDMCTDGGCISGTTALNCDDGNPCTDDSCDPAGGCVHTNNTTSCDDGNACTTADTCSAGACVGGAPPECNDDNVCTSDSCEAATGCVHAPNTETCDDGNACTTEDICSAGSCIGGAAPNCNDDNVCTDDSCVPASGCVNTSNSNACDDENACTTGDICSEGVCVSGEPLTCDDSNICTDDSCDPTTGCIATNNANPCEGELDALACTIDRCQGGSCQQEANNCECVPGEECAPETACTEHVICAVDGSCPDAQPKPNDTPCDDGNACTETDSCQSGVCASGSPVECDDGNICTTDSCNPASGCTVTNNTLPCDLDELACTVDQCSEGSCRLNENRCECVPGEVCAGETECTLAVTCSTDGSCPAAEPKEQGTDCALDDPCMDGACNASGQCISTAHNCDDGNVCTADACDLAHNGCYYTNNTAFCNDGNHCTENDICSNGECAGKSKSCADTGECTVSLCDEADGICKPQPDPASIGQSCDDSNPCTDGTTCNDAGECVGGTGNVCPDAAEVCHVSICTLENGCGFALANEGVECTNNSTNLCLVNGTCTAGGTCDNEVEKDCTDDNACTIDTCRTANGECLNELITACANDDGCCAEGCDSTNDNDCDVVCGNNVVEKGEECDGTEFGNCATGFACNASCACEYTDAACGNGKIEESHEECEQDTDCTFALNQVCDGCHCRLAACGDGVVEGDEVCESNADCPDGDYCSGCQCLTPVCGNDVADPGEQCRDGALTCGDGQICNEDTCQCHTPSCGDGSADEGEQCGELGLECASGQDCRDCRCITPGCGNGFIEEGEQCGEPGFNTCSDLQNCDESCHCVTPEPVCGNGTWDVGEICDAGEGCREGEICTDACACEPSNIVCGNAVLEEGEQCEQDNDCEDNEFCSNCRCQNAGRAEADPGRCVCSSNSTDEELKELNRRVQEITGVVGYDLFIGEGDTIACACVIKDASAPTVPRQELSLSLSGSADPDRNGNIRPGALVQMTGLQLTTPESNRIAIVRQPEIIVPTEAPAPDTAKGDLIKALTIMPDLSSFGGVEQMPVEKLTRINPNEMIVNDRASVKIIAVPPDIQVVMGSAVERPTFRELPSIDMTSAPDDATSEGPAGAGSVMWMLNIPELPRVGSSQGTEGATDYRDLGYASEEDMYIENQQHDKEIVFEELEMLTERFGRGNPNIFLNLSTTSWEEKDSYRFMIVQDVYGVAGQEAPAPVTTGVTFLSGKPMSPAGGGGCALAATEPNPVPWTALGFMLLAFLLPSGTMVLVRVRRRKRRGR